MDLAQKAIEKLGKESSKSITTDDVFLTIQNDHDLMPEYLAEVEEHGVATTNRLIGKDVKATLGLTNAETRANHPVSTLIKSHQVFK